MYHDNAFILARLAELTVRSTEAATEPDTDPSLARVSPVSSDADVEEALEK